MDRRKVADAILDHAKRVRQSEPARDEDADTAYLLKALARIITGDSIESAFGAPGDWGYNTPIGQALAAR